MESKTKTARIDQKSFFLFIIIFFSKQQFFKGDSTKGFGVKC